MKASIKRIYIVLSLTIFLISCSDNFDSSDVSSAEQSGNESLKSVLDENIMNGAYLFAHMTTGDYGGFYYSISKNGVNWTMLNSGRRINGYRGHPDFCKGRNGKYYMIGVEGDSWQPLLWETENLTDWNVAKQIPKTAFDVSAFGYNTEQIWYGAPKMYYDETSDQYINTWHAARQGLTIIGNEEHDKPYWKSIRTFYILTPDFVTYTRPERLFNFTGQHANMATMDAIIRKIDGKYYSFVKDERWPEDISTGYKAIRIARSDNLTGPYGNPGNAITDSWHEAQTLVPNPNHNGWYLYAEKYPFKYDLYEASSVEGTWRKKDVNLPNARHGSMIWIDDITFGNIVRKYYSINGVPLNPSPLPSYIEATVSLTQGNHIWFEGFGYDIGKIIRQDFFSDTYLNGTIFIGPTGNYKLYYNLINGFVYIDAGNANLTYPNGLWICGTGLGFPKEPYSATTQWNWWLPHEYIYCKKTADNIFEATAYMNKGFLFKFFHRRNWGLEETAYNYSMEPANWLVNANNGWNDFGSGSNFTSGVYTIKIDMNVKKVSLIKKN